MFFDLEDIRRSFDAATLERGRVYVERALVLELQLEDRTIAAKVAGSGREPYDVKVQLREFGGRRSLHGLCTCPVRAQCKHAAAAALAAIPNVPSAPTGRLRDAADGAVDSWIESLMEYETISHVSQPRQQLRYVLEIRERFYVPHVHVEAHLVSLLKNGEFGTSVSYDLRSLATSSAKQALPVDRTIGRLLTASGLLGGLINVSPVVLATLLEVMIETGRLHWKSLRNETLHREIAEDAHIEWRVDADGRQRPHIEGKPASILIPSTPLWYVDPQWCRAGPALTRIPANVATQFAKSPALTQEQARRAQIALRRVFSGAHIGGPKAAIGTDVIDRDPIPVLRLNANEDEPIAELQFAYGDEMITASTSSREILTTSAGTAATWPRRIAFERHALAQLHDAGFSNYGVFLRFAEGDESAWMRFLGETVPRLRGQDWRIEITEEFPYTMLDASGEWYGDFEETDRHWFELDLGIDIDGERVPLLPIIIEALARNGISAGENLADLSRRTEPIYGRLPNGAFVALPPSRVARVLATLDALFDGEQVLTDTGRLRIAPLQLATMENLDGAIAIDERTRPSLRRLVTELTETRNHPVELPEWFATELRPYQRDGVAWLQALRVHGFGGVLADDMGLGKTVQLLAHLSIEKTAGRLQHPVLIVAPTSVAPNWRAEIARFTPRLTVVALTGADRAEHLHEVADADIVLTTYALLRRDAPFLVEHHWSIAVLDEAQAVKNPRAKAALVATQIRADQHLALTGTPIENHLEELWSIYAFAVPGLLGERRRFSHLFRTPIEKRNDTLRRSALAARLRPFLMRRTKDAVASELPPKTEIVQRVSLGGAQRDLYETIRLAMHKRVRDEVARRGLARSRIVVLDALLKLRQVCCDPRLLKLPAAEGVHESQKLEALLEMLESLIEDGRRILLFSQFTSMLDLIKPELSHRNVPFVELRGSTRDRETPVQRFQNGEVPLFLISLKAGGTGLNLTAADTVIHYDPWWNPAVERQATDRAHRIGQEQHVFVYKLIAEGTVEERIIEMQERKGALAATLFEEATTAPLTLDSDDIERLFT